MKNLIVLLLFLSTSLNAQIGNDMLLERDPGSCYAKCLIPDSYESTEIELPVYTGGFPATGELDTFVIWTEASTRWVKKRGNKDCLSENPDDCLVWCIVEVPEEYEEIIIVKDIEENPYFVWETITVETLATEGGFTEWKEILCRKDISEWILNQIATELRELDYYSKEEIMDNKLTAALKAALVEYQKANDLPIGSLDFETLDALGIQY